MAIQDTSRPEAPSTTGPRSVSRRDILKGMAVVAGAAALPTILRRLQLPPRRPRRPAVVAAAAR